MPYHTLPFTGTFITVGFGVITCLFGPCVQSNGLDERFNQTLQRMLVKAITVQKELWDEFIDSAVFAYNTSYHESSCYAPFEVMFGRKAVLPFDVDLKSVSPDKLLW